MRSLGLLVLLGASLLHANTLDPSVAERFANLALSCVHREYPNKIAHALNSDQDVKPPRELTPAFYGCYDWHSSVHGHWLLARLAHLYSDAQFAAKAKAALAESLRGQNLAKEAEYLNGPGRATFERPYGLAWLLELSSELREWKDADAQRWSAALKPLEDAAVRRLSEWLGKLPHPVRSGEHSNTAFGIGLALDYARMAKRPEFEALLAAKVRDFYLKDQGCPLNYEPSGEDFLSPCLAEADAVRRILSQQDFAQWLERFLPGIPKDGTTGWLRPGVVTDPSDGKLAHLDGLNLSRAWMLKSIAAALSATDVRRKALQATANTHAADGLRAVTGEHYAGGHWLGSFVVYMLTRVD